MQTRHLQLAGAFGLRRLPPRLDDGHVSGHNGAEILAHIIVARRLGFDTTHLVRGARHDTILPWLSLPDIRPPPPQPALAWRLEVGRMPGLATVHAHLDLR